MKRSFYPLPLWFLFVTAILHAQTQGVVTGRILNQADNEPIEYASVAVYQLPDSTLVNGVVTDEQGRFEIGDLPAADLYLLVQFMGYQNYTSAAFKPSGNVDLGLINLAVVPALLEEVEIVAREIASFHRVDKQVYDARQFQNAQGGSATDVLRNLPSISVNAQGEISVRGATGFVVLINGKPIQTDPAVILAQLPANAIDDIEIITAPSAKYDPDGKAGIINIKTRQAALDGLYLTANTQYGLPSIEPYDNRGAARRYNADLSLNYRKGKWDLSMGMDYKRDDVSGQRIGYVNTYLNDVLTEFPSYGERSFDRESYTGRASVLYSPTEKNAIGASFYAGKRTQERTADILYDYQRRTRITSDQFLAPETYWDLYRQTGRVFQGGTELDALTYFNENLLVRRGDFLIGALDYTHQFTDESSLKVSALYEHTILGGPINSVNYPCPNGCLNGPVYGDTLQYQYNTNDNPLDGVRLQIDYARKLGGANWESGYQFRYLQHPGDFLYLDRDFKNNTWIENPEFTNGINLTRAIHSLYSQISGQWDKLQYTVGLRLEYFDREVTLDRPAETFSLKRFNPFPSVNLQYELGEGLFAKAAYSRRIERTTTFKMTPFPEREHSETLEQGDAELLPEYIDLVEVGLVKNWEDHSVFATAYLRDIQNVINRVNTVYNDSILNRIYTNAGTALAVGLEAGATVFPAKWMKMYLGGNVFNYRIKGDLFGDRINTANTIYSINANANFTLSPTFEMQAAFNYLSERVTAQGVDSRFYNPSLTLRKSFLDNRLALTFQWLNIDLGLLDSNEQRITTWRENFYTTTNYVYEVDILMIGVSYQLNQPSKKMKLLKSEFGDKEF